MIINGFFILMDFLLIPPYFIDSAYALIGKHICSNITERGNVTFCCPGYEERDNMCVECKHGFWGSNCDSTCPTNYYGRKCGMECKCNNYEYCHHVCGCVSNLSESFGNATMFHNVTKIERDISINETKQILFMGQCLSSTENTINLAVSTTGIDIDEVPVSSDHGVYKTMRTVFLVVLPFLISVYLLFSFGIVYRRCCSEKKQDLQDGVHNAIYITEEGNRESNTQSREDTTGDPLYGTFEDPCYSTLTLRVNYGPVHSSDGKGSSEDFNPYDLMYEGKGNVARVQESNDNNFYLDKESVQTQISSTQRLYEDPWRNDYSNSLLHHSSQRRFDLMPVDECCSAPRGKEYGPYELASSD